jgi:hypothetical protein
MDHNWGYVAAGYVLVTVTLVTYVSWLWYRIRRSERSLPRQDG